MGAEDFSFMLEARPGAFIFVGNGDSAGLHHPAYDFNDEVIPVGTSYWVRLVETALRGLTPDAPLIGEAWTVRIAATARGLDALFDRHGAARAADCRRPR